jgi:hypothetical protein
MLSCGILVVFLKYIIKENNLSVHNFTVATVDGSFMFRLVHYLCVK